jgi:hypothetical protein
MAAQDIVMRHYRGDGGLGDRIDAQLRSLGFEERNPLSPKDTAIVDQFHASSWMVRPKRLWRTRTWNG